jgi:hypothetical protein
VEAWSGENVEATRDLMAKLLGAQPGELAFMKKCMRLRAN